MEESLEQLVKEYNDAVDEVERWASGVGLVTAKLVVLQINSLLRPLARLLIYAVEHSDKNIKEGTCLSATTKLRR